MFDLERFRQTPAVSGKARASTIPHLVYVVACPPNYLKVGTAWDLHARLSTMRTNNPYPLTVVRTFEFKNEVEARLAERAAHLFLSDHRHSGEWFVYPEADVIALLEQIAPAHA